MKRGKPWIGFIYFQSYYDNSEKHFTNLLREKFNVVELPFETQLDYQEIKEKTKKCKLIFNNTVCDPVTFESIELSKTLEELGKKVVNSTHSFYYEEDKWMFYLKCLEHHLPTPKTYLLPKEQRYESKFISAVLEEHPLVLKAIYSDNGLCVEKVSNMKQYWKKLKKISLKNTLSPIIAQEFIPGAHRSYRVTLMGYKVKQIVAKIGRNWKQTGNVLHKESFRTVKLPPAVKKMCEKAARAFGLEVCGLDLVQNEKSGKWYLIEANSSPALDFIYDQETKMNRILVNYLYRLARR